MLFAETMPNFFYDFVIYGPIHLCILAVFSANISVTNRNRFLLGRIS